MSEAIHDITHHILHNEIKIILFNPEKDSGHDEFGTCEFCGDLLSLYYIECKNHSFNIQVCANEDCKEYMILGGRKRKEDENENEDMT